MKCDNCVNFGLIECKLCNNKDCYVPREEDRKEEGNINMEKYLAEKRRNELKITLECLEKIKTEKMKMESEVTELSSVSYGLNKSIMDLEYVIEIVKQEIEK